MAFPGTAILEVEGGGSDTNGGGFDPGNTHFLTNGTLSLTNTSAPTLASTSYSFVGGDTVAWVFLSTGTNLTYPGWYKISSVSSGTATLNATSGQGVYYNSSGLPTVVGTSTATGVSTSTSLSSITFGVDYSQSSTTTALSTFVSTGSGNNIVTANDTVVWPGNSVYLSGGTNVNTGWYTVVSTNLTTLTLAGINANAVSGIAASGTGNMGGALASLGACGGSFYAGNQVWIKANSTTGYTQTSNTANTSGGQLSIAGANGYIGGYNTYRGDLIGNYNPTLGTRPMLTASGSFSTGYMIVQNNNGIMTIADIDFNGNSQTSFSWMSFDASLTATRCRFYNFTPGSAIAVIGQSAAIASIDHCEIYNNTGTTAAIVAANTFTDNYIHGNTVTGASTYIAESGIYVNNIFASNTATNGISTVYLEYTNHFNLAHNNTFYGNSCGGEISWDGNGGYSCLVENNYFEGSNGYWIAVNAVSTGRAPILINNFLYNNAHSNAMNGGPCLNNIGQQILSGTALTNASGGTFTLNNTAGAGAVVRAGGYPGVFPGGAGTGYIDGGALQHQFSSAAQNVLIAHAEFYNE